MNLLPPKLAQNCSKRSALILLGICMTFLQCMTNTLTFISAQHTLFPSLSSPVPTQLVCPCIAKQKVELDSLPISLTILTPLAASTWHSAHSWLVAMVLASYGPGVGSGPTTSWAMRGSNRDQRPDQGQIGSLQLEYPVSHCLLATHILAELYTAGSVA